MMSNPICSKERKNCVIWSEVSPRRSRKETLLEPKNRVRSAENIWQLSRICLTVRLSLHRAHRGGSSSRNRYVHSVYYECLPATTWRYGRVSIVGWFRTEVAGCVGRSGVLSRPWPNSWFLDESGPPWPGWPREGEARGEVRGRVIMECAVCRRWPGMFALGRGRDISGRFRRCAVGRYKRGLWMLWFTFLGCLL